MPRPFLMAANSGLIQNTFSCKKRFFKKCSFKTKNGYVGRNEAKNEGRRPKPGVNTMPATKIIIYFLKRECSEI